MLKVLDLFSGIGGFALAGRMVNKKLDREIFSTHQFVEIEPFCQKVLQKNFKGVPVHDDITTYTAHPGQFNLITAGFPCQDISSANIDGEGLKGERSGLFFEVIRLIREIRPSYVVLENVSALLTGRSGRDMGAVLWELSQCGYDAQWSAVSACSVGAPHMRKRVFILAYSNSIDAQGLAFQRKPQQEAIQEVHDGSMSSVWEKADPRATRMVNGISGGLGRSNRVKALGNSVVPQAAMIPLEIVAENSP